MARIKKSLLLCLVFLAACDRPSPPAAPPRQAPHVRRMGEDEAEWAFKETLQRRRDLSTRGMCGTSDGWFGDEHRFYKTDGRLLARAFPMLSERLALEVLNDPEAAQSDRFFAWFILEVLAPTTSTALEDFLAAQVTSLPDERGDEQDLALTNLVRRRFDQKILALCGAQARKGRYRAMEILSTVVDPEAVRVLQGINDAHLLERLAVLQSKEWRESLWHILMGRKRDLYPLNFPWALEAAERQGMPELRSALEMRLQQLRKRGTPPNRRWGYGDPDEEFVLVAWVRMGGALESKEEEYLTFFGFTGDYEQRLQELLETRRKGRR